MKNFGACSISDHLSIGYYGTVVTCDFEISNRLFYPGILYPCTGHQHDMPHYWLDRDEEDSSPLTFVICYTPVRWDPQTIPFSLPPLPNPSRFIRSFWPKSWSWLPRPPPPQPQSILKAWYSVLMIKLGKVHTKTVCKIWSWPKSKRSKLTLKRKLRGENKSKNKGTYEFCFCRLKHNIVYDWIYDR